MNCAVESLSLVYFQPELHYLLGISLASMGERAKAEQAFRTALGAGARIRRRAGSAGPADFARPGAGRGRRAAHRPRRRQPEACQRARGGAQSGGRGDGSGRAAPAAGLTAFDRSQAAPPADRSRVITVVAGLPRSGTSMMMQMTGRRRPAALYRRETPAGRRQSAAATSSTSVPSRLHRDASWLAGSARQSRENRGPAAALLPAGRGVPRHLHASRPAGGDGFTARDAGAAGPQGRKLAEAALRARLRSNWWRVQTWLQRRPEIAGSADRLRRGAGGPGRPPRNAWRGFVGAPFDPVPPPPRSILPCAVRKPLNPRRGRARSPVQGPGGAGAFACQSSCGTNACPAA